MKKVFFLFCTALLIFSLSSCKGAFPKPDSIKTPTSKASVPAFLDLLQTKDPQWDSLLGGYTLDEAHCYNVTPAQVAEETDMQIFKFSHFCGSYVMVDQEIYPLCDYLGGYGYVNAVPFDFDNDGNKDLLVASSYGSGMHHAIISVFNSVTKESTILYQDSSDLAVSISTPSSMPPEGENMPVFYDVYCVDIQVNDQNCADLSYVMKEHLGSIQVQDGVPVFKPFETNEKA